MNNFIYTKALESAVDDFRNEIQLHNRKKLALLTRTLCALLNEEEPEIVKTWFLTRNIRPNRRYIE